MKHLSPKLAALLCIFALTTTACDLLEFDALNNDDDVYYPDTQPDADENNDTLQDDDDDDDDTSGEYDYDREAAIVNFGWNKVKELNHHFCHLAMTCPESDPELVRDLSRFVTHENCVDSGPWSLMSGDSTDLITAVNAGRLKFNATKIDACFQAIQFASTSCDFDTYFTDEIHIGNPCDEVFTPRQADGEACFNNAECFSGECILDPDPEVCEMGICANERPRPDFVDLNDDCTHDLCNHDLFCDSESSTCQPVIVKDPYESCDLDAGEICDDDHVCLYSVCQDIPLFVAEGEACDDYVIHCKIGLSCNYMGDEEPSQCEPVGTTGDFCERQQQCRTGFWCDDDLGECAPESDVDEPCKADEACPFGTFCDDDYEEPVCDFFPIDYDEEFCSL